MIARFGRLCAAVLALVVPAGCGLFDDPAAAVHANPELLTIRVAILPTLDSVPLFLAIKEGYFEREGLDVEPVTFPSGKAAVDSLIAGQVHVAFSSYTPAILAESTNSGKQIGGLKIVADATALNARNSEIVVPPGSQLRGVGDLRGKTIAVAAVGTMAHLLVLASLTTSDVDPQSVTFVEMPFPDTEAALVYEQVDAAFLTEPFLTKAKRAGVHAIHDTNNGFVNQIPLTGYIAGGDFVRNAPSTLAAFQRGIQAGTLLAANRRDKVEPVLVDVAKVDPGTASIMAFTSFQTSLDPKRLQRVVRLMIDCDQPVRRNFDIRAMIVPPAPLDGNVPG